MGLNTCGSITLLAKAVLGMAEFFQIEVKRTQKERSSAGIEGHSKNDSICELVKATVTLMGCRAVYIACTPAYQNLLRSCTP